MARGFRPILQNLNRLLKYYTSRVAVPDDDGLTKTASVLRLDHKAGKRGDELLV